MQLPYRIVGMDHPQQDLDAPTYRALNPFGQIPAIDDDGVVVTERPAWKTTLDAYCKRVEAA